MAATHYSGPLQYSGKGATGAWGTDLTTTVDTDVVTYMDDFTGVALRTGFEGDFDTGNVRYKARERYSFGFSDPRGIFGSPGA